MKFLLNLKLLKKKLKTKLKKRLKKIKEVKEKNHETDETNTNNSFIKTKSDFKKSNKKEKLKDSKSSTKEKYKISETFSDNKLMNKLSLKSSNSSKSSKDNEEGKERKGFLRLGSSRHKLNEKTIQKSNSNNSIHTDKALFSLPEESYESMDSKEYSVDLAFNNPIHKNENSTSVW